MPRFTAGRPTAYITDAAHSERRRIRERTEVFVPWWEYYQRPDFDSEQVAYKRDHVITAARSRGSVHKFEFVRQCWEELRKKGISVSE